MRLYVKDMITDDVREVGLDRHDALYLYEGGLFYRNYQNGEGTMYGGYQWCTKDGNVAFDNEEYDGYYPFDTTSAEYDLISEIEHLRSHLLLHVLGFEKDFEGLDLQALEKLKTILEKRIAELESRLNNDK